MLSSIATTSITLAVSAAVLACVLLYLSRQLASSPSYVWWAASYAVFSFFFLTVVARDFIDPTFAILLSRSTQGCGAILLLVGTLVFLDVTVRREWVWCSLFAATGFVAVGLYGWHAPYLVSVAIFELSGLTKFIAALALFKNMRRHPRSGYGIVGGAFLVYAVNQFAYPFDIVMPGGVLFALNVGNALQLIIAVGLIVVTQRKQQAAMELANARAYAADQARQGSEQRFRDFAESASDWYWETGPDDRFTFLSEGVNTFGLDNERQIGRFRWELAADFSEKSPKWQRHLMTLRRHEPFRDFVYEIKRLSGAAGYVSVSGKPTFDSKGALAGYRGVGRDVTDAVLSDRALRDAKQQAEAANRTKSAFLANMSHELRTPLNAIMGFSDIMSKEILGVLPNAKYLEYARDIHLSAEHLLEIINDLLEMSRIESGQFVLHEEALELSELIESCLLMVGQRAQDVGLELHVNIDWTGVRLWADRRHVRQMLLNLLSNSIKFTPAPGTISVFVEREADDALALRVRDTGIGMSAAEVMSALEPFHQADNVLNKKYAGTGLGLTLVKNMAELQGARLHIESEPGKGTTVSVVFPRTRVLGNLHEVRAASNDGP